MEGVRWRDGPEGKCNYCREWWPITEEFWYLGANTFRMCRACIRDRKKSDARARRLNPAKRDQDRQAVAANRALMKKLGIHKEFQRRWYLNNQEEICRKRREKYARDRAAAGKPYNPRGPELARRAA